MGRVEDAVRRAKEEAGRARQIDGHDVDTLAQEPFPVELGERRLKQSSAPGAAAPQGIDRVLDRSERTEWPSEQVPESEPARAPEQHHLDRVERSQEPVAEPEAPKPTLFQRINAGLAEKVVIDSNMVSVSREQ